MRKEKGQPLSQDGWPHSMPVCNLPVKQITNRRALAHLKQENLSHRLRVRTAEWPLRQILDRRYAAAYSQEYRVPTGNRPTHASLPSLVQEVDGSDSHAEDHKPQNENGKHCQEFANGVKLDCSKTHQKQPHPLPKVVFHR
jgi:hypothetical protein